MEICDVPGRDALYEPASAPLCLIKDERAELKVGLWGYATNTQRSGCQNAIQYFVRASAL